MSEPAKLKVVSLAKQSEDKVVFDYSYVTKKSGKFGDYIMFVDSKDGKILFVNEKTVAYRDLIKYLDKILNTSGSVTFEKHVSSKDRVYYRLQQIIIKGRHTYGVSSPLIEDESVEFG